jgi:hypothetical protein
MRSTRCLATGHHRPCRDRGREKPGPGGTRPQKARRDGREPADAGCAWTRPDATRIDARTIFDYRVAQKPISATADHLDVAVRRRQWFDPGRTAGWIARRCVRAVVNDWEEADRSRRQRPEAGPTGTAVRSSVMACSVWSDISTPGARLARHARFTRAGVALGRAIVAGRTAPPPQPWSHCCPTRWQVSGCGRTTLLPICYRNSVYFLSARILDLNQQVTRCGAAPRRRRACRHLGPA